MKEKLASAIADKIPMYLTGGHYDLYKSERIRMIRKVLSEIPVPYKEHEIERVVEFDKNAGKLKLQLKTGEIIKMGFKWVAPKKPSIFAPNSELYFQRKMLSIHYQVNRLFTHLGYQY